MNSDVMQQWRTHTQLFQQRKDSIMMSGLCFCQWTQCKQESLNHYRIITNIADQQDLQEQAHNIHKVGYLERYYNLAMKICSAQSNV